MSSGEKGETVSVVACCSATGVFLPPLVIFKGIRRKEELGDGLPAGSEFCMTDTGYAQTQTFQLFMKFFCKHKPPGKTLLIMDGHRSHVDSEAFAIAEKENVVILLLPAHTSHELQPLDKAVFKSLKTSFYSQSKTWHNVHPGRSLNKISFSEVFTPAWNKSANRENAVSGFQTTGIYPVNPLAIPDSAFGPSDASDRPLAARPIGLPTDQPDCTESEPVEMTVEMTVDEFGEISSNVNDVNCSLVVDEVEPVDCSTPATSSTIARPGVENGELQRTPSKNNTSDSNVSFSSVLVTPKIIRKAVNVKRSTNSKAVVLTKDMVKDSKAKATKPTTAKPVIQSAQKTASKKKDRKSKRKQTCRHDKARKPLAFPRAPLTEKKAVGLPCAVCGVIENSAEDIALAQDWIQCSTCSAWCHEVCGELGGIFDDDYFICEACAKKL